MGLKPSTVPRVESILRNATRPSDRLLVLSDCSEAGPFDAGNLIECSVTVGCEFTTELQMRLEHNEQVLRAKQLAMTYLSYSQRTEKELRRYFSKKDLPEPVQNEVIQWLLEQQWINDREIGQYLVQKAKLSSVKQSKNMLAAKMINRGLSKHDVSQVLRDEDYDEMPAARALAQKKWQELIRKEVKHPRMALAAYLSRKGFSNVTIRTVLKEI